MKSFPAGVTPPKKVRIYQRAGYFLLQWWDPSAGKTLNDRVDGDLIDAIARAREIDAKILAFRRGGVVSRDLRHDALVDAYLADQQRRADAGQIAIGTVQRYRSALSHYRDFVDTADLDRRYRRVSLVDRAFALDFAAFLKQRVVAANGRDKGNKRPLKSINFVLDSTRAMYEWAADPHRGDLMPDGFRNPFLRDVVARRKVPTNPLGEPDITMTMAEEFLAVCDSFQIRLFAPMVLYGLRAAEPILICHEHLTDSFLHINCIPELDFLTKGHRDKSLPLLPEVRQLLVGDDAAVAGLIFNRRGVSEGKLNPPLAGYSLQDLTAAYRYRVRQLKTADAAGREKVLDAVLNDAGGLTYKRIEGEFKRIAKALGWPEEATMKDFRHLFNTTMANAGLSLEERAYLMGQAPTKHVNMVYIHHNALVEKYKAAANEHYEGVLELLKQANGTAKG
ncbi:MAG: hypothetical protein ACPGYV_03970 [Phycisphaeraceae bacterium]